MSHSISHNDEEILARLLEAYDAVQGNELLCQMPDASLIDFDEEMSEEWHRAKHCLDLLHRVNPCVDDVADTDGASLAETDHGPFAEKMTRFSSTESGELGSIGGFLIRRELGRGGMGVVFLADDPRLNRQVAVKVPHAGALLDSNLRERFLREAEAAARLNHAGIVQVFEVGQQGPLCFIVSEYCSGLTLFDWLAKRKDPVSTRQAVQLVLQIANAVQHAHSRGVLHRDLKPANVMLEYSKAIGKGESASGEEGLIPKLTDFGMAKLMEMENNATCSGTRIGTLYYMSPEQAEGRVKDIDVRTDVYALGAMLYELLTGRPPFVGETTAETLLQVIAEEPQSPSRLRPKLSADLEAVCMKCLEKPLESRYESAAALAEDLDLWLQGRTTMARPTGAAKRLWKNCRRRPKAATLAAVSCLTFLALLFGGWWFGVQMRRAALLERELRQDVAASLEVAEKNEQKALAEKHKADQLLWISKVRLAHEEWKISNVRPFDVLMSECEGMVIDGKESMFAWNYLKRLQHLDEASLSNEYGHKFAATLLDDNLVVGGDESGHATLWNSSTGEVLGEFEGHTSCVNSISLSSDGKYIASASCDETIRIFNSSDRSLHKVLRSPHGAVGTVRFLQNSHSLVSVSTDHTVAFWNMDSGQMLDAILIDGPTTAVAIGKQGDLVVRATLDGRVQWWRRSDPTSVMTVGLPTIKSLALNHAGTQIAAGSADGGIWIWHPDDETPGEMLMFPIGVWGLEYSHDDKTIATACSDHIIRLWDAKERTIVESFKGHTGKINEMSFSPMDRELASASDDNSIKVWHLGAAKDFARIETSLEESICPSVSPDGRFFAFGQSDGTVFLRKTDSSESTILPTSVGKDTAVSKLVFSQDSEFLTATWNDHWLRVWHLTTDEPRLLVDRNESYIYDVHGFSKLLAKNGQDQGELVVESLDGSLEPQKFNFPDRVLSGLFGPKGRFLVVGTVAGTFVCDLSVGTSSRIVAQFDGWPSRYAFSRDGRMVAVAAGIELAILKCEEPDQGVMLRGHTGTVGALAFAPDGLTIASGANDQTVRLWHLPSGQEMLKLEGHEWGVVDLAFSESGNKLYSIAKDGEKNCSIFCWPTTRQDYSDQGENREMETHRLKAASRDSAAEKGNQSSASS